MSILLGINDVHIFRTKYHVREKFTLISVLISPVQTLELENYSDKLTNFEHKTICEH